MSNGRSRNSAKQALPKRRPDLIFKTIEGETVILNREKGVIHQLNQTATIIWDSCDGKHAIDDMVDRLAMVLEIDSTKCRKDVVRALADLRNLDLLERA